METPDKMKVADLKKELDSRGIEYSKSAKKAELVEKLTEVLDEEALEAEVLGESKPSATTAPETKSSSEALKPASPKKASPVKAQAPEPTTTTSGTDATASSSLVDALSLEKKMARAARFGIPVDEKTQLQIRAERFGLPPPTDAKEEAEKLAARAKRFGTTTPAANSTVDPELEEKKRKRAERFGIPYDTTEEQKKSKKAKLEERNAKKSGIIVPDASTGLSAEEEEKRKARAIRFGTSS